MSAARAPRSGTRAASTGPGGAVSPNSARSDLRSGRSQAKVLSRTRQLRPPPWPERSSVASGSASASRATSSQVAMPGRYVRPVALPTLSCAGMRADHGRVNVFTDYAETHRVPINGEMVTVQTIEAAGRRRPTCCRCPVRWPSSRSTTRSSTTPRLPPCSPRVGERDLPHSPRPGSRHGRRRSTVAPGVTLRFLVLGDSLAFGTGAASSEHTLGARLGRALQEGGEAVELQVVAIPGATSLDLARQVGRAGDADVALLVVGANDVTRRVAPAQSATALGAVVRELRSRGTEVLVVPTPALPSVVWMPPASRAVVAGMCDQLRSRQPHPAEAAGAVVAPVAPELSRRFA